MLEVGYTRFTLAVPALSPTELERYSVELFDEWEAVVSNTLVFSDYSLLLEVEEGSLEGKGKIAVAVGVFYAGVVAIGTYGDFVGGLETIHQQVTQVGNVLFEKARTSANCDRKDASALATLRFGIRNIP